MSITPTQLRQVLGNFPGIRQALIFGSVASGRARPDSDLDIAVEADHPLDAAEKMRLIEALTFATGRPVDLIDLKTASVPLLGHILAQGRRVLGSNTDHAGLLRRHLFDAADFQPYVDRMLRERRQAWTDSARGSRTLADIKGEARRRRPETKRK